MPQIPQYNRETRLNASATPYQSYSMDSNTFGASIGRGLETVSDGATHLANTVDNMRNTYEEAIIAKGYNDVCQWEQDNLYDKDKGYYYKVGENAAGKSPEVMKSFDDFITDYKSKTKLSPLNQKRLDEIIARKRLSIEQGVNAQDYKQTQTFAENQYELATQNSINTAVSYRNNDKMIDTQIANIKATTLASGQRRGLDNSTIAIDTASKISDLHCSVIAALTSDGDLKVKDYYNKHKNEIAADKQVSILNLVNNLDQDYTARTNAEYMSTLDTEAAYKYLSGIKNPVLQDKTEREYNQIKKRADDIQRERDGEIGNNIMQEVYSMYDNGGGNINDIIAKVNRSDLSLETKAKIYSNLKEMQELEGAGNNWADYNYLLDLATEDNEKFKQTNAATYNLTKDQYNKIVQMQRDSKNIQYTPEVQMKELVKNFNTGFAPQGKNGLHRSDYEQSLIRTLSKLERLQGKAFDINKLNEGQLANIIAGFDFKDKNQPNKNIDETKELYMRAKKDGEIEAMFANEYMNFKTQNKRDPNAEEIYNITKKCYNTIETEYKRKAYGKVTDTIALKKAVDNTVPKKGETKVLTYYADTRIPEIGRKLGTKFTYVNGARYRAGDSGGHGKGYKLDVSMSEHSQQIRYRAFEELAAEKGVLAIGTSDPLILKRFAGNPKLRDMRQYDMEYKKRNPKSNMNHVNHFDITFDTQFGGTKQGLK